MNDAVEAPGCMRLIGASLWSPAGSAVEHLLNLRSKLARANHAQGLRCALMYTSGWLVRWFEGPAKAVENAWTIVQDEGARGTRVLHRSIGESTLTLPVHIATLHGMDKATDFARRLHRMERLAKVGSPAEPREVWHELSAPCQLDQALAATFAARRDVVAITSEHNESVDLLLAIAQRWNSRVSYQRFAEGDARRGDVGAAYSDLACGNYITRLQALSRRALKQNLVRLGLSNMRCLVLLLGKRAQAGAALAESAAELLMRMPIPSSVHLVGTDGAALGLAASILRSSPGQQVTQTCVGMRGSDRLDAVLELIAGMAPTATAPLFLELG